MVVDNGSSVEETLPVACSTASRRLTRYVLIENGENLGIGAALNIGVRWAEANGSQWVALFDQDSTVTEDFIAQMLADFEHCARRLDILLLLMPRYRDPVTPGWSGRLWPAAVEDGGPFVTITVREPASDHDRLPKYAATSKKSCSSTRSTMSSAFDYVLEGTPSV